MKSLRLILVAAVLLAFCAGSALAGTVKVPEKKTLITVEIPNSWKPETTDRGISCESPDQVATVFFEVAGSEKAMNKLMDENIDWLIKDQGLKVKKDSELKKDILVGGIASSMLSYDADSKEFGPSKVGFVFTMVNAKLLVITFWLTVEGFEKHETTLDAIFASVKPFE